MTKNAPQSLRHIIETCELSHAEFSDHYNVLKRRIDDAISGSHPPALLRLIGPSRVGKSMLITNLARHYPDLRVNGIRQIPVLVVEVPSPVSPKEMPKSVLQALGVPTARGNSVDLFAKMKTLLEKAGTKVVLFEEASHIVEVGTKMPPRAAGDWFKQLLDRVGVTVIMFGVPHLEKLFASNEQLRKRAQAPREFRPYDPTDDEQRKAFGQCVITFAKMFADAGRPFDMSMDILVPQCFLFSGGLVGVVSKFMSQLAYDLEEEPAKPITKMDCVKALKAIEASGHPEHPAFERDQVTLVEMEQAHIYTLEEAKLSRRRR
ncbi:ATP-binding protein [Variovorax ureilyticus]|uniref:ATP-binding protein n=1 Tax=Variovorax ureilyticus TaxID=1836198 RepID=UPI003D66BBA5